MTFLILQDLITTCATYKPFAAPFGLVEKAWEDMTQQINKDLRLQPKMSWEVAQSTINWLRKMHKEGIPPSALKLKLTDKEHTAIASGLDGLSNAYRKHKDAQAGIAESKKQKVIQCATAGARVREKAIKRLSQQNQIGTPNKTSYTTAPAPTCSDSPHQPKHAALAPAPQVPHPSMLAHLIGGLISGITSAINLSKGYRSQQQETFQTELIKSVQDLTRSETRSAEALEGIFEVLKDIQDRLLPETTGTNGV
ncbi:hypothetical protein RHS02_08046, partial [Rhizoctonia solani]